MGNHFSIGLFDMGYFLSWDPMLNAVPWRYFCHGTMVPHDTTINPWENSCVPWKKGNRVSRESHGAPAFSELGECTGHERDIVNSIFNSKEINFRSSCKKNVFYFLQNSARFQPSTCGWVLTHGFRKFWWFDFTQANVTHPNGDRHVTSWAS